jgi:ABC-type xylose transport system permease subunit
VPIAFGVPSLISIINGSLTMNGVTLVALDGAAFGESEALQVIADIQIAMVPEPGTALLLGLSLAALSAATREKKRRE